jgi:hypothetical protein
MTDLMETIRDACEAYVTEVDTGKGVRAALAAIDAAGFAIVPKEPTEEMETAYWRAQGMDRAPCDQTWDAMLAAAPKVTA